MRNEGNCRYFDLMMSHLAGQICHYEAVELEEILNCSNAMKQEFMRLNQETHLLKSLQPLLDGVLARPYPPPALIQKQLQLEIYKNFR
tara:strand:- start:120 stop:383 length:264 start_codon:yes stop_codon:yes gene_type:complete